MMVDPSRREVTVTRENISHFSLFGKSLSGAVKVSAMGGKSAFGGCRAAF